MMEVQESAIIMVGLTRVGISTVFNWLLEKPMIGKGNLMPHYIPQVPQDCSAAVTGNCFTSVTLAPNICKDFVPNVSLVDMGGYEDTRDYIGVVGKAYFIKALFQRARKVKFVIVFDENKFSQEACSGLIRTFQGFINMFDFSKITEEIKKKLFNSMSCVVTRAKHPQQHYQYLTQILLLMEDPTFLFDHKPLIVEMLQQMRDYGRLQCFRAAKDKQNPQQCALIQNLDLKGWQFCDLDQCEVGQLLLTFYQQQKQILKLPSRQIDYFTADIRHKIDENIGYLRIFHKIVKHFALNQENIFKDMEMKVYNDTLSQNFGAEIKMIEETDVYISVQIMNVKQQMGNSFLLLAKHLTALKLKFKLCVEELQSVQDNNWWYTDPKRMEKLKKDYFDEIFQLLNFVPSSQAQRSLFARISYILGRQTIAIQRICQILLCIKLDKCYQQVIYEYSTQICLILKNQFVPLFEEIQLDFLIPFLHQQQQLQQYQLFFNQHSQSMISALANCSAQRKNEIQVFLKVQGFAIQTQINKLFCAQPSKHKNLLQQIESLRNISSIMVLVSQNADLKKQPKKYNLAKLGRKKLKVIKKIVQMLISGPKKHAQKNIPLALQLAMQQTLVHQTYQIYLTLLHSPFYSDKIKLYEQFADFCISEGRLEQAYQMLTKKLHLQQSSQKDESETLEQMGSLITKRAEFYQRSIEKLKKIDRVKVQDTQLEGIIHKIQKEAENRIQQQARNQGK